VDAGSALFADNVKGLDHVPRTTGAHYVVALLARWARWVLRWSGASASALSAQARHRFDLSAQRVEAS